MTDLNPTTPLAKGQGTTFRPLDLSAAVGPPGGPEPEFAQFVAELRRAVEQHKDERWRWYSDRRRQHGGANRYRALMAAALAIGVMLTALTAALQMYSISAGDDGRLPLWALFASIFFYAAAAGLAFYERTSDLNGAYFRSVMAMLSIRDLWSTWTFAAAKLQVESAPPPTDPVTLDALRVRWLTAAQEYVVAVDAVTKQEASEWSTAAKAALAEFNQVSAKGLSDARAAFDIRLQEVVKTRSEMAAAAATASLNVEVKTTDAGAIQVTCDDKAPAAQAGRFFLFKDLPQGVRLIRVQVAADPVAKLPARAALREVTLKGGPNEVAITPT